MLEFRILGPLEIRAGERDLTPRREKHRALVAALVLHAGEVVSADRLIDELWGASPPRTAKGALQNYVSLVRKSLGEDVLVSRPPGYLLDVTPEQVDLGRFERLLAEARAALPPEQEGLLRQALALWRGPPLADLAFEPVAQVESARLEELRLAAQEELVETRLVLGQHAELVPELEALIAQHPYRERLRGQLMLALYRSGRQADALDAYQHARHALDELLGLEPSPALRELQQAILRQDDELAPPSPTTPPTPAEQHRKTVTVLFSDVIASTALTESLDPEATRMVMSRYFAAMRAAIEYHGGTVEKFIGDEVMAVFGVPVAHEDDALRAVRAASLMQESLTALNDVLDRERGVRIAMRIGVNTGEVIAAGDASIDDTFVTGDAVNIGKRLEHAADDGDILIGEQTHRLVRHAIVSEAVHRLAAHRVLGLVGGAPALARQLDAPLVDREQEIAALRGAFERARDERRCALATVLGDPGIGKTRLVRELLTGLREEATVLVGRCVSYGDGATYLPLGEIIAGIGADPTTVLAADGDRELVTERIAELLGRAGDAGSTGEGFWAVRRLFGTLARTRPLVCVFEDVHWAEPTLLDLIEYLAGEATEPMLVLCLARPQLLEARRDWPDEGSIRLSPLPDEHTRALIAALDGEVADELHDRIAEIAEGNPLFVEQLLAYARETGASELVDVPPTVEALLASRVDGLEPAERAVLERAAVVGRDFWRGAVVDLLPPDAVPGASSQLVSLVRRGLVRPERSALFPEDAFRFDHVLIRDVAYAGIPKELRAELHERHADWLDAQPVGSDELVGYHLEQAYRYGADLGPVGRRLRRLAADAGERLGAAGIRAWKRGDAPATVNLLGRATELLPARDSYRLELMCELAVALQSSGEIGRAEEVLGEAHAAAIQANDRRMALRARMEAARIAAFSKSGGRVDELLGTAREAVSVFEAVHDDRSLARAWLLIAIAQAIRCQFGAVAEAAGRALPLYRRSGWSTQTCLGSIAIALLYGSTPVPEAMEACATLLGGADLGGEARVLAWMGGLQAWAGRFDAARRMVGRARVLYGQLGQSYTAEVDCGEVAGEIELLAGNFPVAEDQLRASCAALERVNDRGQLSLRSAQLAEALYASGRYREAAQSADRSKELAAGDDVYNQCVWRSVRAKLLARDGDFESAVALGREAVSIAQGTDSPILRGNVLLALAEVLRLAGERDEATGPARNALVLFEQKGHLVGAERAQLALEEIAAA
jgi:DNA-binding SARP family transcriptional activator